MNVSVDAEPKTELPSSMVDTRLIPLDDLKRANQASLKHVGIIAGEKIQVNVAAFNSAI